MLNWSGYILREAMHWYCVVDEQQFATCKFLTRWSDIADRASIATITKQYTKYYHHVLSLNVQPGQHWHSGLFPPFYLYEGKSALHHLAIHRGSG